eukprot:2880897-Pyramimonas_sp.AAC.1
MRGRKLVGPEKVAANKEVEELNAKMAKYVKQELCDDAGECDEEISTWPVETYNYVDECFCDDKDEVQNEDYVEAFYTEELTDNYLMERSGAQRTIQIPGQAVVLFHFCALAVHGVCLPMSPTV